MLTPQRAHLKINLAKGKTRYVPGRQLQRPVANNSALYSNNSLLQLQQQFCILQLTFVVAITVLHFTATTYFCSCNCSSALCSNSVLLQQQLHLCITYFCSCNCTCAYCSSNLLLQWQVQLCTLLIQFNFAATAPCSNNLILQL